jgi:cytochrome c oxidase accessory protein FixG
MTTARTFGSWRRIAGLAQVVVFLGLPFVRLGGESALRLDVPAGRLQAFGASFAIEESFVVLPAVLVATFAFLLATLVLGRAWCGWSCPQTVLGDLSSWVVPERRGRPRRFRRPLGFAAVALISVVAAAGFLFYFVAPLEFFSRLASGRLGPVLGTSWAVLGGLLFADLSFLRQTFCATACPYARLQGVLLDRDSLVVSYDRTRAADCVDCGACVRVCPTGIDIRDGLQMQCIACAACIDACQPIMRKLRRAPDLVCYSLGDPAAAPFGPAASRLRRLLRPAALALLGATALSAAALMGVVLRRGALDLQARPESAFAARRAEGGRVLNAFSVDLENRTRGPLQVSLALEEGPGEVLLRPDRVDLAPGERRRLRVLASARAVPTGGVRARLVGEARSADRLLGRASADVPLAAPGAP